MSYYVDMNTGEELNRFMIDQGLYIITAKRKDIDTETNANFNIKRIYYKCIENPQTRLKFPIEEFKQTIR